MDTISAAAALRFFFFFSLLSALLLLNPSSTQAQKPGYRTFASSKIMALLGDPLSLAAQAQQPQRRTFSFSTFVQADEHNFSFSYDSGNISQGALQLTPRDTSDDRSCFVDRSGRILFANPFHLWQNSVSNSTKHIASFNTSFTVNVHPLDKYVGSTILGHGLTFLIAPSHGNPPAESFGQYLGLTNNTLDGNPSNRIIAVELDTFKQSFDPDGNHIGLDINSVRSSITAPLSRFEIEISPSDGSSNNVWIDYNGSLKYIWVYMAPESWSKPSTPVIEAPLDLSENVSNLSYFRFAASTGDAELQLNCVKAWNLSVELLLYNNNNNNSAPHPKTSSRMMVPLDDIQLAKAMAVATVVATVVATAVAVGVLWCFLVKRKKVGDDPSVRLAGTLQRLQGTPREFELKMLKKATNNFDESLRLGHGGFGIVYKGVIHGEDTEVAVKKFSRDNVKGKDDFLAELSIINRLRHKHLVRLLGE